MSIQKMIHQPATPELPNDWYIRIGKEDSQKELFCCLNGIDMLIVQQSEILGDMLSDSLFSEELSELRQAIMKETWGEES